jgi:hypothetical protein
MLRARRRRLTWALAAGTAAVAVGLAALALHGLSADIGMTRLAAGQVQARSRWQPYWKPLPAHAALAAGTRLRTGQNGYAVIQLDTGSQLRVDAQTELQLAAASQVRLIQGRVYLESGPKGAAPVIHTPLGQVRDIGTQFETQLRAAVLRVRVRSGAVLWSNGAGRSDELELGAASEFRIDASGHVERRSFAPFGPEWDWAAVMSDPPDIDGVPLGRFLEWAAHESGRALRYDSDRTRLHAERVILHGQAPRLRPLPTLGAVLSATDFDYTLAADGAIVVHWRVEPG